MARRISALCTQVLCHYLPPSPWADSESGRALPFIISSANTSPWLMEPTAALLAEAIPLCFSQSIVSSLAAATAATTGIDTVAGSLTNNVLSKQYQALSFQNENKQSQAKDGDEDGDQDGDQEGEGKGQGQRQGQGGQYLRTGGTSERLDTELAVLCGASGAQSNNGKVDSASASAGVSWSWKQSHEEAFVRIWSEVSLPNSNSMSYRFA